MAFLASKTHMPSCQWEGAQVVIEIGILPIGWIMTGGAIRAILPCVFVILLVAGVAIHGCAFELPVDMT